MSRVLRIAVSGLLSGVLAGALGCAAQHDVYTAHVDVSLDQLVPIAPGSPVSVLADADQPVFVTATATTRADWLFRDGAWFRADDYRTGQWVHVAAPPDELRRIARPQAYRHFLRRDESAAMLLVRHTP